MAGDGRSLGERDTIDDGRSPLTVLRTLFSEARCGRRQRS